MNKKILLPLLLLIAAVSVSSVPASVSQPQVLARESMHEASNFPVHIQGATATVTPLALPPVAKATNLSLIKNKTDMQPRHEKMVEEVLGLLPHACVSAIQNLYVRYDSGAPRGLAGKDSVIVSGNVPDKEFRGLLLHEILGHVMDLSCLKGTVQSGVSDYKDGKDIFYNDDPSVSFYQISWSDEHKRKTGMTTSDFVSGYAYGADAFEDLAETVTYYALEKDTFQERAKKSSVLARKLAWVETYVFPKHPSLAVGTSAWNGRDVPWDTTKLAYEWTGLTLALAKK